MEQTNDNFSKGHTQIPHWLFHCLLLLDLSERDWKVTMLLIRLTLGCQKKWAKLQQCDLKAVGITENHAKEVLIRLLDAKIIVLNEKVNAYAVNEELPNLGSLHYEPLRALVTKQLVKTETSQNGNHKLPEMGSSTFPQKEEPTSQNGKITHFPNRELSISDNKGFTTPKDILKIEKYSDTYSLAVNNTSQDGFQIITPKGFQPSNEGEAAAYEAWNQLEHNNPLAFSTTYYTAYKKGLPASLFYQFVSEIKQDESIKNRGAIFNNKVKGYFEQKAQKEGTL